MEESNYARTAGAPKRPKPSAGDHHSRRLQQDKAWKAEREKEQKLQAAQGMQCTNRCTSSRLVLSGDEQAPRELCMWRLPHHFS